MNKKSTPPPRLPIPIPKEYNEARVRKGFWPKFKRVAAQVPGISEILALYFYLNSDLAPAQHKLSIIATLAYFLIPLDIIPDILGPLGYTDDVFVAMGLIKFIGADIMKPYRAYARKWLKGEVGDEGR